MIQKYNEEEIANCKNETDIQRAKELARAEHERKLEILTRLKEYNQLVAEQSRIKDLIKSKKSAEICLVNHKLQTTCLDFQLNLARIKSKLIEANYQLDIQLPTKMEVYQVQKLTETKSSMLASETEVLVYGVKTIGKALVNFNNCERLAEARAINKYAQAINQYCKAFVLDKFSQCVLNVISNKLRINPEFRFKLERPLRLMMRIKQTGSKKTRRIVDDRLTLL